jgi:hypothetical protein
MKSVPVWKKRRQQAAATAFYRSGMVNFVRKWQARGVRAGPASPLFPGDIAFVRCTRNLPAANCCREVLPQALP